MMCNHSFRPIERMRHSYCFSIPAYFLHWNTVHVMKICVLVLPNLTERDLQCLSMRLRL